MTAFEEFTRGQMYKYSAPRTPDTAQFRCRALRVVLVVIRLPPAPSRDPRVKTNQLRDASHIIIVLQFQQTLCGIAVADRYIQIITS